MSNTNFPEPDASILAELQAALAELDLATLPTPGLTPYLGVPTGDEPDPDGDRDWPGPEICPQCDHRLRLDSEGRCCSCGYC